MDKIRRFWPFAITEEVELEKALKRNRRRNKKEEETERLDNLVLTEEGEIDLEKSLKREEYEKEG